jgi:c-di-GMP-related signal transduction protein
MDNNYLVGRQPILNRLEEVVAYELLFRSPRSLSSAFVSDATMASANVMINILSNFGISDVLGSHRGFINVEVDLLMSDSIDILPAEMIGLELLENIKITPDVVERCRRLKAKGCLLALDDHEYGQEYEVLYDGLIDVVKFDVIKTPLEHLYEMTTRFKKYPVKMLAEKVDSRAVYLRSRGMGFELFQGYFFARPSLIQKRRLEDSAGILFELLRKLNDDLSIDSIEDTFRKSPALTYKLLLLVNSVATGMREKIRTVRHALTIVGLNH